MAIESEEAEWGCKEDDHHRVETKKMVKKRALLG